MSLSSVFVSSEVFLLLSSYALSTEREETLAILLGRFLPASDGADGNRVVGAVERCLFCQRRDKRKDRVEISSEQLSDAISYAESTGTFVVGWAHSHPHITVFPSAVDLRCQNDQQMLDRRFFGLILSCFNEFDGGAQRSQLTCFQAYADESGIQTWVKCDALRGSLLFRSRREVPVFIKPTSYLSLEGLRQFIRIPEIFMTVRSYSPGRKKIDLASQEEKEFFQNVLTDQELASDIEKKIIMSYHSGLYIKTITLLVDKLCGPMLRLINERNERNKEEIRRLQLLIQQEM
ncbi:JAB1/Mov34/MPN/PAD-1 ubiquitin protease-domain-containing protein [Zopfochytrium polystomum]|nr:JAB1/Mov34/MPN/PAD-1 ubiquitin protease-domain-containing protein [Zopfochytrium polystomum]